MLDDLKKMKKKIGIKECCRAVENDKAEKAFVAKDVEEKIIKDFINLCKSKSIEIIYADTMKDLGKACGINIGASTAVILKDDTDKI